MTAGKDATLYDFPVSNNGGRCRVVIYDKGLQDKVSASRRGRERRVRGPQ
jgi:hypothetical protein